MNILIKNGHVIDPKNNISGRLDVLVKGSKIIELGENLFSADSEVINAKGMVVTPGLVDMHCHLREPGQEYKDDIETGTKSAAAGGFTSIACMPNTVPVIDNKAVVRLVKSRPSHVNVYPIGAITKNQEGKELAQIGEMKEEGIVAISDDGHTIENSAVMRNGMSYASNFDLPVIDHCEDKSLATGVMNSGYISTILGLKGISKTSEEIIISRDILLAEGGDLHIHLAHISTKGGVELVRQAKKRGVKVTCETCPHYFSLTEEACDGFNTYAKINPPLRNLEDVEAIKEGLKDGTIDAIATDHAPHHIDEKNIEFQNAAFGAVGFETAFAVSYTYLVKAGVLTLEELIEKMTYTPAQILRIPKGTLEVGASADIAIFDINQESTIDAANFKSKAKNTPFDGYKLNGKVITTIVGGKFVMKDSTVQV